MGILNVGKVATFKISQEFDPYKNLLFKRHFTNHIKVSKCMERFKLYHFYLSGRLLFPREMLSFMFGYQFNNDFKLCAKC